MHVTHLFSIIVALAFSISSAVAECCGGGECVSWNPVPGKPGKPDGEICNRWKCADGFVHGNFQCCGVSKCNVFCCNCDKKNGKVCRTPKTLLMDEEEQVLLGDVDMSAADETMFENVNVGGTGNMTIEEFVRYFGAKVDDAELVAKFELYDKNGDGFLQVGEMRLA
ncbi:hypothetical protein FKW77_001199 [Venturia effusa]|uniref:EF-hand domain-containing protein n=1 Tax=Venturia effusa TaxID=50376 RepID=A0A517LQS5_9PEZI|nr:hypothetical protein FKW77_001199 [Venturia effusa]